MSQDVISGIIVGGVGGAAAGLVLWLIDRLNKYEIEFKEKRRVRKWLGEVTSAPDASHWRSTRAIASHTDLTEDRVRYLCGVHPEIVLSSGESEVWGIKGRAR